MSGSNQKATVAFVTLGCAKNEVDTRHMSLTLSEQGFKVTDDLEECDCVVVNTCAFIEPAAQESIDEILDLAGRDSLAGRGVGIVVAGCLPSRFGEDLEDALTEVRSFVPCDKEGSIADAVAECIERARGSGPSSGNSEAAHIDVPEVIDDSHIESGSYAYVKISDGCSRFCSYCTIPFIRGPYRSLSLEDIDEECSNLIEAGAREIVLIGQDTGIWGSDLAEGGSLAGLLSCLAERHPDTWFRVMYTQPEHVTDELLEAIASHENVCSYLDIPMQHCNERILRSMNRSGSRASLSELIERARATVPDIAIRTTLMCGFPGETEEDFEELVGFVEESRFDYVGVFAFSPEEGTKAATMDDEVPSDEREYRAERLRTIADAISASVISERVGMDFGYLCEGCEEDGQHYGRCMCQAPEVDGVTFCDDVEVGAITTVRIEDSFMYDMEAEGVV